MATGEDVQPVSERRTARSLESWLHVFGWALVGVGGFAVGAYVAGQAVLALLKMGVQVSPAMPLGQLVLGVILYGSMLALLIGVSRYRRYRFTRKEVGLGRMLSWRDIALSMPALVLYFLLTFLGLKLAGLVPGFDANQVQINDLGPLYGANRGLVFLSLVVFTPFIEEIIFRGFIYGRMRRARLPWWIPALVVSIIFGVAHLQWNVGIDVFCLSIVLCALREVTGSIWAGVLVHMVKNAIAFFVVFGVVGF